MEIISDFFRNRWIYLTIIIPILLLGINEINNEFLYFFFFADKPKSFQKKYKKNHSFIYRYHCLFVFNSEYMKMSRFYKYIVKYYIAYVFQISIIAILLILSFLIKENEQTKVVSFVILLIILFVSSFIYFMWLVTHSKKEHNFYWYIPSTWHRCRFYINLH